MDDLIKRACENALNLGNIHVLDNRGRPVDELLRCNPAAVPTYMNMVSMRVLEYATADAEKHTGTIRLAPVPRLGTMALYGTLYASWRLEFGPCTNGCIGPGQSHSDVRVAHSTECVFEDVRSGSLSCCTLERWTASSCPRASPRDHRCHQARRTCLRRHTAISCAKGKSRAERGRERERVRERGRKRRSRLTVEKDAHLSYARQTA